MDEVEFSLSASDGSVVKHRVHVHPRWRKGWALQLNSCKLMQAVQVATSGRVAKPRRVRAPFFGFPALCGAILAGRSWTCVVVQLARGRATS